MMKLTFTTYQMVIGGIGGVWRRANAIARARHDRWECGKGVWHQDVIGGLGELGVALVGGLDEITWLWKVMFCALAGDFRHDVGPYQVKTIDYVGPTPCLNLTYNDRNEDVYILAMVGELPQVIVAGWAWGWEVKTWEGKRLAQELGSSRGYSMLAKDLHLLKELPSQQQEMRDADQTVHS